MVDATPGAAAREKACAGCRTVKPLADFARHASKRDGRRSRCKQCVNRPPATPEEREQARAARRQRVARRRQRDPEAYARQSRDRELRRHYGITLERFEEMLAEQGHRCASCGADEHGGWNWHVDHCHQTGRVRGILCFGCNAALGQLGDDPARILALAAYAQQHQQP